MAGAAVFVPLLGANKSVNLMAGSERDFQGFVFLIEFCVIWESSAINAVPQVTLMLGITYL